MFEELVFDASEPDRLFLFMGIASALASLSVIWVGYTLRKNRYVKLVSTMMCLMFFVISAVSIADYRIRYDRYSRYVSGACSSDDSVVESVSVAMRGEVVRISGEDYAINPYVLNGGFNEPGVLHGRDRVKVVVCDGVIMRLSRYVAE